MRGNYPAFIARFETGFFLQMTTAAGNSCDRRFYWANRANPAESFEIRSVSRLGHPAEIFGSGSVCF